METKLLNILHIWMAGGWTMIPLLLVALFIYGTSAQLLVYFSKRGFSKLKDSEWRSWVLLPETGEGEVGEIIRYTQDDATDTVQVQDRFTEIVSAKIPEVDRRLAFLNVMVGAAPLLGLLGTVLGMLATFQGISVGGSKTIDLISSGISEALITTEMGLLIALPGYMLVGIIKARRDEYEAFLARLESFTVLQFQRPASFSSDDLSGPHGLDVDEADSVLGQGLSPVNP